MRPLTATPALRRLPFGHFSAFDKPNAELRKLIIARDGGKCQECGLQLPAHMEVRHLDDNHENSRPKNLVCVCPFCHMRDHLHSTGYAEAGILIANPALTQGSLNALTLACWFILSTVPDKIDIRTLPKEDETDELQVMRKNAEMLLRTLNTQSATWANAYVSVASQPDVFAETLCALFEHSRPAYDSRLESTKYLLILPQQAAFERQCKDWFAYYSKRRPPATWARGLQSLTERMGLSESELMERVKDHVASRATKAKPAPAIPVSIDPPPAESDASSSDAYGSKYD